MGSERLSYLPATLMGKWKSLGLNLAKEVLKPQETGALKPASPSAALVCLAKQAGMAFWGGCPVASLGGPV